MKCSISSKTIIQVQLDETIMNNFAFLSQKKAVFSLKEVISLLPRNLNRDTLFNLHQQLGDQILARTSMICEMIPDDVWKAVFQLIAYKDDISKVFPLKQVCKRWQSNFSSAIEEARIRKSIPLTQNRILLVTNEIFTNVFIKLNPLTLNNEIVKSTGSLSISRISNLTALDLSGYNLATEQNNFINHNNLSSLVNLEYLNLRRISCYPFESLKKLVKLKDLDISQTIYSTHDLESIYGVNLEIINHLKSLKIFSICRRLKPYDFIDIIQVQKLYPHVRFRWLVNVGSGYLGYYEGSFSEDNKMSGKGKLSYNNGNVYEGEFNNDLREGKGIIIFCDLSRYEGEFKNDKLNGEGVYTWPGGHRYEGQLTNDKLEGKGVLYFPNGDRFEGEFKNNLRYLGRMFFADGRKYTGYFDERKSQGKGTMFYLNGNRYEGIFDNDSRVGEGVFYYSNGKKVEGDELKFRLNNLSGTIEEID